MPSTRTPNLVHTALFLVITFVAALAAEGLLLAATHPHALLVGLADLRLQLLVNIFAYGLALALAALLFPLLWHRTFLDGLHWNASAARPRWLLAGLALGFLSQGASTLLPKPQKAPIEDIFHNHATIWIVVVFGTLVGPLFEEILFRGFLLPSLAIAVDYMRLPRSLEAHAAWQASERFSTVELVSASILTSIPFALIHGFQLAWSWPSVALLMAVSLVLCAVRCHTRSVAAGTLVHMAYNFSVFVTIFIVTHGFRYLDRA